jgi:hypothetical protein
MINPETNTALSRKEVQALFEEKCTTCRLKKCVCQRPEIRALETLLDNAEKESAELKAKLDEKEKSMSELRQSLMRQYSTTSNEPARRRRQRAILDDADAPVVESTFIHRKVSKMSSISRDVATTLHREEKQQIKEMQERAKRLLALHEVPADHDDRVSEEESKENIPRPDFSSFMSK